MENKNTQINARKVYLEDVARGNNGAYKNASRWIRNNIIDKAVDHVVVQEKPLDVIVEAKDMYTIIKGVSLSKYFTKDIKSKLLNKLADIIENNTNITELDKEIASTVKDSKIITNTSVTHFRNILPILTIDTIDNNLFRADHLFKALDITKTSYSNWVRGNIERNKFLEEGTHYYKITSEDQLDDLNIDDSIVSKDELKGNLKTIYLLNQPTTIELAARETTEAGVAVSRYLIGFYIATMKVLTKENDQKTAELIKNQMLLDEYNNDMIRKGHKSMYHTIKHREAQIKTLNTKLEEANDSISLLSSTLSSITEDNKELENENEVLTMYGGNVEVANNLMYIVATSEAIINHTLITDEEFNDYRQAYYKDPINTKPIVKGHSIKFLAELLTDHTPYKTGVNRVYDYLTIKGILYKDNENVYRPTNPTKFEKYIVMTPASKVVTPTGRIIKEHAKPLFTHKGLLWIIKTIFSDTNPSHLQALLSKRNLQLLQEGKL